MLPLGRLALNNVEGRRFGVGVGVCDAADKDLVCFSCIDSCRSVMLGLLRAMPTFKLSEAGEEVVHAAYGHHDEILAEYPYTVVVATADACSASRPGARRESLDRYIKRMEELEFIAKEFKGVRQAYAVQAGREVRVIASAKDTDDAKAALSGHGADAFDGRKAIGSVEPQDKAGDLEAADVQNRHHAALHGRLPHGAHRALTLIKLGHCELIPSEIFLSRCHSGTQRFPAMSYCGHPDRRRNPLH